MTEIKKVRIQYLLSEAGRKQSILTGGDGKEHQVVEGDITPVSLGLARVKSDGSVTIDLTQEMPVNLAIYTPTGEKPRLRNVLPALGKDYWDGKYRFDAPQAAADLVAWEKDRQDRIAASHAELQPELDRLIAAYEKGEAELAAKKALEAAEREKNKAAEETIEKAIKALHAQDKIDWIALCGSDHLKRATALGYNCQRYYVLERAEHELPGFTVDFNGYACWKERSCPGETALTEVERLIGQGHNARVVWLTEPPYKQSDEEHYAEGPFEPCEAIVISDYLGKYQLVQLW